MVNETNNVNNATVFRQNTATLAISTDIPSPPAPGTASEVPDRVLGHSQDAPEFLAVPRFLSPLPADVDLSAAHLGASTIGLPLFPQGLQLASLLEAKREDGRPLYRRAIGEIPRRGTKTETVRSVLLGRCLTIPGYSVISTAQDGTRASVAMRELMYMLDGAEDSGLLTRRWSNGGEAIYFANGSRWERRPPKAGTFRGAAADALWFDEAGEYDAATSEELVQGALPLLATRKQGQVIITGTPGPGRSGLLWDMLTAAMEGKTGIGALDYGMGEDDDPDDEAVWWRCHPGLACGLIDLEFFRESRATMSEPAFMTEMLAHWPRNAVESAIDPAAWDDCAAADFPDFPASPVFAFDCETKSASASIVAVWRDENGVAWVELVDQRPGTDWLAQRLYDLLLKYPKSRVIYDGIARSAMEQPAAVLVRNRKVASRVKVHDSRQVHAGQDNIVKVIDARELRHTGKQAGLSNAATGVQWRTALDKGRWFAWSKSGGTDISPIRAAAIALWECDQNPKKRTPIIANG